ncbi:MAG: hypothetical protein ACK53L_08620, partial [Pirellulaceae bacterium]
LESVVQASGVDVLECNHRRASLGHRFPLVPFQKLYVTVSRGRLPSMGEWEGMPGRDWARSAGSLGFAAMAGLL